MWGGGALGGSPNGVDRGSGVAHGDASVRGTQDGVSSGSHRLRFRAGRVGVRVTRSADSVPTRGAPEARLGLREVAVDAIRETGGLPAHWGVLITGSSGQKYYMSSVIGDPSRGAVSHQEEFCDLLDEMEKRRRE